MTVTEAEKELLLRVAKKAEGQAEIHDIYAVVKDTVIFCDWLNGEQLRTIARVLREAAEGWRPISEAKKDGTIVWAKLRDDIYPALMPGRDDLARWNGVQIPLRHPGLAEDGFDIGWGVAAPVGHGGFPDEWIAGFLPLPSPPSENGNE